MSTMTESHYPALLADLEARVARHEQALATMKAHADFAAGALDSLRARIADLEQLWRIAQENPELVRELAAQALQGRKAG